MRYSTSLGSLVTSLCMLVFLCLGNSLNAYELDESPKKLMQIEDATLVIVNDYREKKRLETLRNLPYLQELAREHSFKMAEGIRSFGHSGWETRADKIFERIEVEMVAENVAFNKGYKDPAKFAVEDWLKSRRHKENIINEEFDITGIGVAKSHDGVYYFTQIFASYLE